tara:strand:+ start:2762 stop:2941 length:180 start_codon:yes stop_codon:yes gene_type:complete
MAYTVFMEQDCPKGKKMAAAARLLEGEDAKIYILGKNFTMEQYREVYGEDAVLPRMTMR